MKKTIYFLTLMSLLCTSAMAQQKSCCQSNTTCDNSMVALADDKSFKKAHLEPKKYVHENGLGKKITYTTGDGKTANAYEIKSSKPSDKYLFVIQEWWGMNDYILKESDKIYSSLGGKVNVIALDLYDGKVATNRDSAASYMKAANTERIVSIIKGAITYAGPKASIATTGWCFGGGWSLQASLLAGKQDVACIMYYGMPETDATKLKNLNGELLGIFATQDKWINNEVVNTFEQNLKADGKKYTIKKYDADHAFANPSNPGYNKAYTEEAYTISIAFLRRVFGV